ncbi:MAG TPA: alpha/beta hydrolase [Syntrophorhabdaceae bacterium]|nr:alpha/beta hydrolase [Syntrophorhabdaceae bacterium]
MRKGVAKLAGWITVFTFIFIFCSCIECALARQEIVSLSTRYDANGRGITLTYLIDTPDVKEMRCILFVIPGGNGLMKLSKKSDGTITHALRANTFMRLAPFFRERSIGLAFIDVPSDHADGINTNFRKDKAHLTDLEGVVKDLKNRYPSTKIYMGSSGSGGISALFSAKGAAANISGVILAGADYNQLHAYDHSGIKIPVIALHHMEDGCDSSPFLEAKEVAEKYSFGLVPFSGGKPDTDKDPCGSLTKHGFVGLEGQLAQAIDDFMEGRKASVQTAQDAKVFLNEHVVFVPMQNDSQEIKLQTTVFQPDGAGPFPLIVLSHGVPFDKAEAAEVKYRQRFSAQAQEFVNRGFVVAIPMRRGYGLSGGRMNNSVGSTIHTFGLEDAKDIKATVDFMSRQPAVDPKRIVLVGQSGGGLASLAYGSLADPNVKGIINFAGGLKVTSRTRWDIEMADAFGNFARTTKVPSLWFYTENDSYFPPDVARRAYEAYQKNGGQAKLIPLAAFRKDGHLLFHSAEGNQIWREEVLKFLAQIGF